MMSYDLTETERLATIRACAHGVDPVVLHPEARWRDCVTDLMVARVMRALEAGTPIARTLNGRWFAPSGSPLNGLSVSVTVQEMIRVGLVTNVPRDALVPAAVHMQWLPWWRTMCGTVPEEGMGPRRVRLVIDPVLVDCLACLDRL